jgi:hypothetical protein
MEEANSDRLFAGLAEGPCVQGGEPLVGGRGMVAYAECLWTAASGDDPPISPATCQGPCMTSARDDEGREATQAVRFAVAHQGFGECLPAYRMTSLSGLIRSLSLLSLTLRCAALRSGWLEGCATLSEPARMRRINPDPAIDFDFHSPAPWQSRGPQGALLQEVGVPSEDLDC